LLNVPNKQHNTKKQRNGRKQHSEIPNRKVTKRITIVN